MEQQLMECSEECIYKIFWPMHLCRSAIAESGYLVGWMLDNGDIVVASKSSFANSQQVNEHLAEFYQGYSKEHENSLLYQPHIVGYMSCEGEGLCEPDPRNISSIWIDAFTARTQVGFRSVLLYGLEVPGRIIAVLYEESAQTPWHFYTAAPINLDLSCQSSQTTSAATTPLQQTLDYVNTAGQVLTYLHGKAEDEYVKSSTLQNNSNYNAFLAISSLLLQLMDTSVFSFKIKEFSAVGQQLDLIVRRFIYLVENRKTPSYSRGHACGSRHNAQYASYWNGIWVVVLDIILGCVAGICLIMYSKEVSNFISAGLKRYTVTTLVDTIKWFRGWPAGLKLNNGLDYFLADLFLWLIHFWTILFQPAIRYIQAVVIFAGWSGFTGGLSMQLAILSDTMALTTLHTYWFYMVATRIFHWQLAALYSLFNLFRGRKHNVLRNRIDSCDYDLDQLLIGTILFTLLTYLFPTVLVYYATFAGRRMAVIMGQGLLEILLGILNHCPVFYIMLHLRDSRMFPGGVSYQVETHNSRRFIEAAWFLPGSPVRISRDPIPFSARDRMNVTVVSMESLPLPFSALFFQYYQIWVQFSANYLSMGLLRSLMLGDVVRPVPRLQHTMIPGLFSTSSS